MAEQINITVYVSSYDVQSKRKCVKRFMGNKEQTVGCIKLIYLIAFKTTIV